MNYKSIQSPFIHEIEIKKSRFICYLYPLTDANDFPPLLQNLKKEHYKANHHCSAYIIGHKKDIQKMSDDGEPTGTAGVPMLEVLKKQDLTYIAAVVVRYFGGIKLGAGGLIRAYSDAVSEALKHADIIQNIDQQLIQITFDYHQVDSFQYFLANSTLPITILDTQYTDKVTFTLAIHLEKTSELEDALTDRFNAQFQWDLLQVESVNIPYLEPTI